jgi:hypothetical protein
MRPLLLVVALAACRPTYEFETVEVGTRSAKTPRPKSNSQFVRAAYADLLSRAPESYLFEVTDGAGAPVSTFPVDERQALLDAADSLGDPAPLRALIVTGLVAGAEATLPDKGSVDARAFVRTQFQRLLGREPSPYELAAFVEAWAEPDVGPRAVVRAIVGSREYQSF